MKRARQSPERLFVGVDAAHDPMIQASRRASMKPARGGAPNALFVLAPVEQLPPELDGAADEVTVWFPWGSLLRAVALPDRAVIAGMRRAARTGATLEVVFSYDTGRDGAEVARLGLPPTVDVGALAAAYADAGFDLRSFERVDQDALRAIPSTWAQRHARGRLRGVWRLRARAR